MHNSTTQNIGKTIQWYCQAIYFNVIINYNLILFINKRQLAIKVNRNKCNNLQILENETNEFFKALIIDTKETKEVIHAENIEWIDSFEYEGKIEQLQHESSINRMKLEIRDHAQHLNIEWTIFGKF